MYECAAITMFLCDRYPNAKLAPKLEAPERSLFLQTLLYFASSVQIAFQLDYHPYRFAEKPEEERSAQRRGHLRLRETWNVVIDQIGDNHWILGDVFSAVDIYLYMLTTWLNQSRGHAAVSEFPNVQRIADEVTKRESIRKVYGL